VNFNDSTSNPATFPSHSSWLAVCGDSHAQGAEAGAVAVTAWDVGLAEPAGENLKAISPPGRTLRPGNSSSSRS